MPYGMLSQDANGNLYGTTTAGGTGNGVIFEFDNTGKETVLYAFTGGAGGSGPYAGVTLDSTGNLFGTTSYGGEPSKLCSSGCGVVYRLDKSGREQVLYSFLSGGGEYQFEFPVPGVVLDKSGNVYSMNPWTGNAKRCGACGSVYKIIPGVSARH
jgi:uncharacterized repeat protein (TIGR03803 family)